MAAGIPARLTAAEGRKFGLTVGIAFGALGGVVWWRGHPAIAIVLGTLGGLLVLAGLAVPTGLGPVQRTWMGLAHAISKITTPLLMGLIYFGVLAPIGLAMRLLGRNPLTLRHGGDSIWVSRERVRGDLERQF